MERGSGNHGKSEVANVSLEILVRTSSRSNWTPLAFGVQLLLRGGPYGPLGNTLLPKNIKQIKNNTVRTPTDGIFLICA